MRILIVIMVLLLLPASERVEAECISKDGENIKAGFLECAKDGNRYIGEIDRSIVDFLVGTWSTNCSAMKSKIVYQFNNLGQFTSQIYHLDSKDNTLKLSVFLEILGLKLSGGLVYMAGKSHIPLGQPPSGLRSNVADYVLVVYQNIDKNTRSIEDGYTIKDGVVEQEIKDGALAASGTKVIYFRCPEELKKR
ncbi:hypothetical protein CCP3SC15_770006 [Gammaproteobacteria bacterium]